MSITKSLGWSDFVAQLQRAGYEGEVAPGDAACKAIAEFVGTDGTIVTDGGDPITMDDVAELAGVATKALTIDTKDDDVSSMSEDQLRKIANDAAEAAFKQYNRNGIQVKRPNFTSEAKPNIVPASAKKWGSKLKCFSTEELAYGFGQFINWTHKGAGSSRDWLLRNGYVNKAMAENVNSTGGALVPDQFVPDLIRLVEEYGVARNSARVWPMVSDTLIIPRRTGGLTLYYPGEGNAITESNPTYDNVQLVAKKAATLTQISSELMEDAAISVGEAVGEEIALAFAQGEDNAAFIGDGTSTYGTMVGVVTRLNDGNHAASVQAATGTTYAAVVNADIAALVGKLPEYARPNAQWWMHSTPAANVFERLAAAAGGNTWQTMEDGSSRRSYWGYPVNITQAMNSTAGASANIALFGDMRMACAFGDRRSLEIATSTERYFDSDQIAIRGIERFDFVAHDCGDASTAGPLLAFNHGT